MALVQRTICKCDECGHEWIGITESPARCPSRKCRSVRWNDGDRAGREEVPVRVEEPGDAARESEGVHRARPKRSQSERGAMDGSVPDDNGVRESENGAWKEGVIPGVKICVAHGKRYCLECK